jgi:hypothetical protein
VRRSFDWGADLLGMLSALTARRKPDDEAVAEGVALNLSSQKRSRGVKGVKNRYGVGISIDSEKHIISWHPV